MVSNLYRRRLLWPMVKWWKLGNVFQRKIVFVREFWLFSFSIIGICQHLMIMATVLCSNSCKNCIHYCFCEWEMWNFPHRWGNCLFPLIKWYSFSVCGFVNHLLITFKWHFWKLCIWIQLFLAQMMVSLLWLNVKIRIVTIISNHL